MGQEWTVLCFNAGSSSIKVALWQLGPNETLLNTASIEGIGAAATRLQIRDAKKRVTQAESATLADHAAAERVLFDALDTSRWPTPDAVGHRIVHGGRDHRTPQRVDAQLIATLRALTAFAPLHLPAGIACIEAARRRFGAVPQVACFDTAFHSDMPESAQRLALPRALWDLGIRRYGFHGLSYEYVVQLLGAEARGRAIIAHLGNGASMTALRDGRPIDTSMGFSPSGGLMMGTRSGDLDPGVLLHLMTAHDYDAAALERLVDREAGLLGVSGLSADMQTLLEARERNTWVAEAIDLYCYQLRKQIGAFSAVLGGVDTLIFTGGIGEHAAAIRASVCAGLEYLGIALDADANSRNASCIHQSGSACVIRVVTTDEDLMIARHTRELLAGAG